MISNAPFIMSAAAAAAAASPLGGGRWGACGSPATGNAASSSSREGTGVATAAATGQRWAEKDRGGVAAVPPCAQQQPCRGGSGGVGEGVREALQQRRRVEADVDVANAAKKLGEVA